MSNSTQDSQSDAENIEKYKLQALALIDQYVHQHAQQTFIKWCEQGRTEEQIWAVQNFLTGAFKEQS